MTLASLPLGDVNLIWSVGEVLPSRTQSAIQVSLLEAIGVIVYDPDTAELDAELPPEDSGLRWSEFVQRLATAYEARFEE